jgi:hypothetical protein
MGCRSSHRKVNDDHMRYIGLLLLFTVISFFSCKDKGEKVAKIQDSIHKAMHDSIVKHAVDSIGKHAIDSMLKPLHGSIVKLTRDSTSPFPAQANLTVTAYLIYKDGSLSTFDVLNDENIVLRNTIIGEGDAEKPSTSTKICLDGRLDSLKIKIKNGHKLVIDTATIQSDKHLEFVIRDTGCEFVEIDVTRHKRHVYTDTIHFRCAE